MKSGKTNDGRLAVAVLSDAETAALFGAVQGAVKRMFVGGAENLKAHVADLAGDAVKFDASGVAGQTAGNVPLSPAGAFILSLIAAHDGRSASDVLARLIAEEGNRIGLDPLLARDGGLAGVPEHARRNVLCPHAVAAAPLAAVGRSALRALPGAMIGPAEGRKHDRAPALVGRPAGAVSEANSREAKP